MRFLGLYLSWIISVIAFFGSLFFQYLGDIEPNTLSWYQKVCMEPLVIILAVASFKQFYHIIFYVLPQIVIGGVLALIQLIFRLWPTGKLVESSLVEPCQEAAECIEPVVIAPQSLPVLSLISFLVIFILLVWGWKRNQYNSKAND